MPEVLRVVGPPGSGKSLLITSLTESLRSRGYRTASIERRDETTTVIAVSTGSRSTIERSVSLAEVPQVVGVVDPNVHLIFAEGYEEPGAPAVEVRPKDAPPMGLPDDELIGIVETEELTAAFARGGPGETIGIADEIERLILNRPAEPEGPTAGQLGVEGNRPGRGFGRVLDRFRWPG